MRMPTELPQCERDAVEEAQRGSTAGFEFLYRCHERRVYSFCLRVSRNPSDAEELVQTTFLQAFRKIATFRGECEFTTWLHRETVKVTRMHLQRNLLRSTPIESHRERRSAGHGGCAIPLAGPVVAGAVGSLDRIHPERAYAELQTAGTV